MILEDEFRRAYSVALEYADQNWKECESGFSKIIELNDSWFFGRNESKDGHPIIDNFLGIIVAKQDLSISPCFGGSKEHHLLKEGKVINFEMN